MSSPKEFRADRPLRLPGKNIEDSAANRELSARRDLRDAFVAGGDQRFDRPLERLAFSPAQGEDRGIQRGRIGRGLVERRAGRDNDVRAFVALNAIQEREPLRRDLRIGQNIFDGGEFGFRQEERVRQPVEQTFVKQFLGTNVRAEDPEGLPNLARDRRDQERLRRFGDVRERDRPRALSDLAQLLRDRFAPALRSRAGNRWKNLPPAMVRRIEANFKPTDPCVDPEAGIGYSPPADGVRATARKRGTSSAKTSGTSACSPSLLANSGESCTSIMIASAPAATAASAICGTNSRRPIAVRRIDDDRQMRFRFQDRHGVEIEGVTRGVFERANAALAEEHVHVAFAQDVFGAHDQIVDRGAEAAFEQDGQMAAADFFQERKIVHVARADLEAIGVALRPSRGLARP